MGWRCSRCNCTNRNRDTKCEQCGLFKSKSENGVIASPSSTSFVMKSGDWICCSCNDINFASRNVCRKCGKNRPLSASSSSSSAQVPVFKEGDWYCSGMLCLTHNFGTRIVCYKCGKARVNNTSDNMNYKHEKEKEEEEEDDSKMCIICMDRPKNTCVKLCGHLGYCFECAFTLDKCPVCRISYNPNTDLIKVYNV